MNDSNPSKRHRRNAEGFPPGKRSEATDELVRACIAGDRDAMGRLYQRCGDQIYALMLRMVGHQDVDDLTQQVFLHAFGKLDQFQGEAKLETWLYRLATNEALQHLRRQQRRESPGLAVEPAEEAPDGLVEREQATLLQQALLRIDPQLRAILSLKEERGLSYREIAEVVGVPEGTVGSRLNRARKELRRELIKIGWCE